MGIVGINNFMDKDFYSGSQAGMFIGNMFIDDVYNVQFQVQAGLRPVYGFKSANYDILLRENEIVAGSFTINFKEAAYLYLILKEYNKRKSFLDRSDPNLGASKQAILAEEALRAANQAISKDPIRFDSYYNSTIEDVLRYNGTGSEAVQKDGQEYDSEMTNALQRLRNISDSDFENKVEALEDMIWGEAAPNNIDTGDPLNFKNDPPSTAPTHFRGLQETPFNITMTYGDFTSNAHNHTLRVIRDIMLTGSNQVVDMSGRPIQEQYTFIARKVF